MLYTLVTVTTLISKFVDFSTVDSGYQAHALVGTIAKIYALHNEVRYITGVKG